MTLSAIFLFLIGIPSYAEVRFEIRPRPSVYHYYYCPDRENWYLHRERVASYNGGCSLDKPLNQTRVNHYFPRMRRSLSVGAWQGSYTRKAKLIRTYQYVLQDCRGRILENFTQDYEYRDVEMEFSVVNPNLDVGVSESFVAQAPMTDQEAQSEMEQTRRRCVTSRPGR